MSDSIKHECGIALIRLLKPLSYYQDKYGTPLYGINKLYLLMEKQHNRGQDGAGVATIKLDMPPGQRYISRHRSNSNRPVADIFQHIHGRFSKIEAEEPEMMKDTDWLKHNMPYTGELLLGHLRYGTHGGNSIENCHPFLRQNNWMTRNLVVAGNFNMTNVDELVQQLLDLGQHPKERADTVTVLEKIGHFLDDENQVLFDQYKKEGFNNVEITHLIADNLDVANILTRSAKTWDGGYTICGLIGHGDAFVMRDPAGIRPAFYYKDDEVVVVTSERPAIQTAFNVTVDKVHEIKPGHCLIIKKNGLVEEKMFSQPTEKMSCSFERIYFSRGNDADIYTERKNLGRLMVPKILESVDYDFENTVFSFIPNTAEVAFFGMLEGLDAEVKKIQMEKISQLKDFTDTKAIEEILKIRTRSEKIALKDAKLRTFITDDLHRNDLVTNVYDSTYGVVKSGTDNIVLIDDSIVRGTTLKQSILKIMDRLGPKKIVIVSSAPQIRYPDCYGIDMSRMGDFVTFQAAISLIKERGMEELINEVYYDCKRQENIPRSETINSVKKIYKPFTVDEISDRISEIVKPKEIHAKVKVIFQSLENLHAACPDHKGDWYFSGDYPTPGGNRVVNKAFMNYVEGKMERAY